MEELQSIRDLERGDIVRNKAGDGSAYVVNHVVHGLDGGARAVAIKAIEVTNAPEWLVLKPAARAAAARASASAQDLAAWMKSWDERADQLAAERDDAIREMQAARIDHERAVAATSQAIEQRDQARDDLARERARARSEDDMAQAACLLAGKKIEERDAARARIAELEDQLAGRAMPYSRVVAFSGIDLRLVLAGLTPIAFDDRYRPPLEVSKNFTADAWRELAPRFIEMAQAQAGVVVRELREDLRAARRKCAESLMRQEGIFAKSYTGQMFDLLEERLAAYVQRFANAEELAEMRLREILRLRAERKAIRARGWTDEMLAARLVYGAIHIEPVDDPAPLSSEWIDQSRRVTREVASVLAKETGSGGARISIDDSADDGPVIVVDAAAGQFRASFAWSDPPALIRLRAEGLVKELQSAAAERRQ